MLDENSVVISKARYQEMLDDIDELKFQNEQLINDIRVKDARIKKYETCKKSCDKKIR